MKVDEIFDKHAEIYDSERERLIPGFPDFYGLSIDVMDFEGDDPRVFGFGCGDGYFDRGIT